MYDLEPLGDLIMVDLWSFELWWDEICPFLYLNQNLFFLIKRPLL